ncbi:MAG: hypothetical protein WC565_01825 [Parcubacteria group bacterium]
MGIILNPNESFQPRHLATSTVAMSIYNVLAVAGRELTVKEIYHAVCTGHNQELPPEQVIEAMHGLCKRRFLCVHHADDRNPTERFSTADKLHRVVRSRDRSGDGWDNWRVVNQDNSVQRLEEINVQ